MVRLRSMRQRWLGWCVGLALLGTLGALVVLQSSWLGELADAQREASRRSLTAAAERLGSDLRGKLDDRELDAALASELVPPLLREHFGEAAADTYRVAIVSTLPEPNRPAPLYASHADEEPEHAGPPDVSVDLHLLPNQWLDLEGPAGWVAERGPVFVAEGDALDGGQLEIVRPPWRIEVRHRAGSLEAALDAARRRNLVLAGGMLAVLVGGLALLWVGEQRARRAAERELAFVAGVSHELRTPLAVVRTAASNLSRAVVRDPEQVGEYGALIEREVERVSTLVERVLRFSGGEQRLDLEPVELGPLVAAAIERCAPWRDRKDFDLEVELDPSAATLRADGSALTSALHNLVENSIKYGGDRPAIRVTATRSGDELRIGVSDRGPGVPRAERARVFEPFYRGAAALASAETPGSGLGLAVAADVARAHGGRLELTEAEAGAHFTMTLPLEAAP